MIEILIAMAISAIVMSSIYSLFMAQVRIKRTQEQTAEVQQNIRSAMYIMEREIRMAGYTGTNPNTTVGAGFTLATATAMTFSYVADNDGIDNDGNNDTDETGEMTQIQYAMYDSDGDGNADDIGRTVDGGTIFAISPVAENIEEIEFYYTIVDNAGVISQTTTPAIPPANLSQIRSVQMSILARSGKSSPNTATGKIYTTPSGNIWGDDENYNDGFYRRYITSNIICRNLN